MRLACVERETFGDVCEGLVDPVEGEIALMDVVSMSDSMLVKIECMITYPLIELVTTGPPPKAVAGIQPAPAASLLAVVALPLRNFAR